MTPLQCLTRLLLVAVALLPGCNENTLDPVFYGSLAGTVTYKSTGLPVAGAEITTTPATTTLRTDDQGYFLLERIPTGEYTLTARSEAYKNASVKVMVTRDNTTQADLQVVPDASPAGPPAVVAPVNGDGNVERTVTLKWTVDRINDDVLTYDVTVFGPGQENILLALTDHPDTVAQVQGLAFNTSYFWQVNVKNSAGVVTHGPLWRFKTRPFPDNRYLFTSRREGNYEIYSSDASEADLVRLTFSDKEQVFPQFSHDRKLIAYAEFDDLAYHLYIMNHDGSAPAKVTTLPLAGYHSKGNGFCWSPDNGELLYGHYDKLYTVRRDGSNLTLIATAPPGRTFGACDWSAVGNRIVVETVGVLPFESEVRLIDLENGTDDIIIPDEPGVTQSPSFSVDGNSILFTRDVSGFESPSGRQLDSRPILYHIGTGTRTDLSRDKQSGTNDLYPRFSPDGAKIIFENRSNDGSGTPTVYSFEPGRTQRVKLFEDAGMPGWK